jgi:hypothetical protein
MARTMVGETKREGQRNAKRPIDKNKKLVPLVVGNYFTHSLSNVTYMQFVKYNSNERFRTSITYQRNLLFIVKIKAC